MDRDVCALVTPGNLPGNISPERHCPLGWREVHPDPAIQPPGCSADWLLALWKVCWSICPSSVHLLNRPVHPSSVHLLNRPIHSSSVHLWNRPVHLWNRPVHPSSVHLLNKPIHSDHKLCLQVRQISGGSFCPDLASLVYSFWLVGICFHCTFDWQSVMVHWRRDMVEVESESLTAWIEEWD